MASVMLFEQGKEAPNGYKARIRAWPDAPQALPWKFPLSCVSLPPCFQLSASLTAQTGFLVSTWLPSSWSAPSLVLAGLLARATLAASKEAVLTPVGERLLTDLHAVPEGTLFNMGEGESRFFPG